MAFIIIFSRIKGVCYSSDEFTSREGVPGWQLRLYFERVEQLLLPISTSNSRHVLALCKIRPLDVVQLRKLKVGRLINWCPDNWTLDKFAPRDFGQLGTAQLGTKGVRTIGVRRIGHQGISYNWCPNNLAPRVF